MSVYLSVCVFASLGVRERDRVLGQGVVARGNFIGEAEKMLWLKFSWRPRICPRPRPMNFKTGPLCTNTGKGVPHSEREREILFQTLTHMSSLNQQAFSYTFSFSLM